MSSLEKSPRLYISAPLQSGQSVIVPESQHHYLKNVLRMPQGAPLRIFHEGSGEYAATIRHADKKQTTLDIGACLRPATARDQRSILIFTPLKKDRMDFLIEKAVELGVTDFYPITTQNSDIRSLNSERVQAQIIEAAEQCERVDLPTLHALIPLNTFLRLWDAPSPIFAAIERRPDTPSLHQALSSSHRSKDKAVLIGPAGGWSAEECDLLSHHAHIMPINLGPTILRAETAAIAALSLMELGQ